MVSRRGVCLGLAGLFLPACPAVYPELSTRLKPVPKGLTLEPPPPDDVRWLRFRSGSVPKRTRGGRAWDQVFGSLPDPYAVLFIDDQELIRSPTVADTLAPVWKEGTRGNFELHMDDRLRVELWDDNPLNDKPIGVRDLGRPKPEWDSAGEVRVTFDSGAEVVLAWEPAHALLGLGLWYELRTRGCRITRLLERSPASRAGLKRGDAVVRIADRHVDQMSADEVRSAFGAVPVGGLSLLVRHQDGTTSQALLDEGPIYPLYGQYGNLD